MRRSISSRPKSSENSLTPFPHAKTAPSFTSRVPTHPGPAHTDTPFALSCCGAGVAADAEMTTRMAASNMELHALSTGREPRVATVTRLLRQTLFRCWGGTKRPWGGAVKEWAGLRRGGRGERAWRRRPETGRGRPQSSWATGMNDVPEGVGLESRSGVGAGGEATG